MTAPELIALAEKHGFEIEVKDDGNPVLKKLRDDAVLPGRVLYQMKLHRQVIVNWYRRQYRPEWEKCRVCLAEVHRTFDPNECDALCFDSRCPYKDARP
jgi:hypothetical protein